MNRTQQTWNRQWNFVVPVVKGTESNTLYYNAIKDFNSLPNDLKTCENICLKKRSKKICVADGNR